MTEQSQSPASPSQTPVPYADQRVSNAPPSAANRRVGRGGLVAVMIVALLAAGVARTATVKYQARTNANKTTESARSALGGMNTFALGLLLGGLRGPLVMVLWTTSENQKQDKDLDDFNTKVEWIRNLQPEFDTVHMFQMWNLAYNVSVQMASLPNRYAVIIEALDYGRNVNRSRPDNINILHQSAQIYSNKLGTIAQEKTYYRRRVREDSLPRPISDAARRGELGFQRRRMDPILDEQFRVLPEYLVARHPRPDNLAPDAEWYTGEELQFLRRFEPYPQGVSTYALSYNYSKRAEVLMNVGGQKPLQLSDSVIDSRPALELKAWSEEDWGRGRASEIKLYGLGGATRERVEMEAPTQDISFERPFVNASELSDAIYSYQNAIRVSVEARSEYKRHLSKPEFVDKSYIYAPHTAGLLAMEKLLAADVLYLQAAATSDAGARKPLLEQAATAYREAVDRYELLLLTFYVDDQYAKEHYGTTKDRLPSLTAEKRHEILMATLEDIKKYPDFDGQAEDRAEFMGYVNRANARLKLIGG